MVFHSFQFLLLFLPAVYGAFVLAHRVGGWPAAFKLLVVASLAFYAQWSLMLLAIHRWLPDRPIVVVADGEFAALEMLQGLCDRMAVITRLRKDACLFDPPPRHTGKPRSSPACRSACPRRTCR